MYLKMENFHSFYGCVISHCMYIHLVVYGHTGGFHFLAIVNSVAMNIDVHVSFFVLMLYFSPHTYPDVELQDMW